jgi:hypothetical protein
MANDLTSASPTMWARMAGYKLYNSVIFKNLASFKEESELKFGQIVDRPYRANLYAADYTKGGTTANGVQDLTYTTDKLTVNNTDYVRFLIDDIDGKQNKYDTARLTAEEAGTRMGIRMDSRFLFEATNASTVLDDGDFGGTDGNALAVTTSNIDDVFGKFSEVMDTYNVPLNERSLVMSPYFKRVLWNRVGGKDSDFGDKTAEYGNVGTYNGFKLYVSNNLTCSAVWTPADDPSDAATIAINGVTFTFKTTIGTTAGNVLRGTSVAVTIDALVALINTPGTSTANGIAFTGEDLSKVQMMYATDGTSYITVYVKGANTLTLTTSEALDVWSKHSQWISVLRPKYSIDMAVQKYPNVEFQRGVSNGLMGDYGMLNSLYGIKTFNAGTTELVSLQLDETKI